MGRSEKLYLFFVCTFCTILVVGNVIGSKLIPAPFPKGQAIWTGILIYPFTFLIGDIVSEIWGEDRAHFMVRMGFFMNLILIGIVQIGLRTPFHPTWGIYAKKFGFSSAAEYQNAFDAVFGLSWLLVAGSLVAYLAAQWTSVRMFHILKSWTSGRHLWIRNNVSTIVSQFIDTLLIGSLVFFVGFQMDWRDALPIMACIYGYKVLFALLDTPLAYLGIQLVKRSLDSKNPLSLSFSRK